MVSKIDYVEDYQVLYEFLEESDLSIDMEKYLLTGYFRSINGLVEEDEEANLIMKEIIKTIQPEGELISAREMLLPYKEDFQCILRALSF